MKLLLLAGCAAGAALYGLSEAPAAPAFDGGTVVGTVTWKGDLPEALPALEIDGEKSVGCCPDGVEMNTVNRTLLIDRESKGIANVAIFLEHKSEEIEHEVREEPYVLDQVMCRYEPHVLVVPEGATIRYQNSDGVNHNVHTTSRKNQPFNNNVAAGGHADRAAEYAEPIGVVCDVHPWMGAHVIVTDSHYFGVTGEDGTVTIEGLLPGEYKGEYWHEKLGKGSIDDVTVTADGTVEFSLELSEGGGGGGGRRRRR